MPANTDKLTANFNVKLYKGTLIVGTPTEASVETLIGAANAEVVCKEIGELTKERAIIDIPRYGVDGGLKLPGAIDFGTFDFSQAWDFADAQMKLIRDDDGKTEFTWVLEFPGSSGTDYAAFNGYIGQWNCRVSIRHRDYLGSYCCSYKLTYLVDRRDCLIVAYVLGLAIVLAPFHTRI